MNCEFPAAQLVKMRREIAKQADMSSDPEFVSNCCNFVMAVDRLRLAHEDVNGCQCWYEHLGLKKGTSK